MNWLVCAVLSAVFASLTTIFAKIGIQNVNSTLATAIRTAVVLVMAWGMVFVTGAQGSLRTITPKSWIFLAISGVATGASWLFYYKAIQLGEVSKVTPIDKMSVLLTIVLAFLFLGEKANLKSILGALIIGVGTLVMVL